MIQIDITTRVIMMGIPTAVTGFCFWLIERNISKRDKDRERKGEQARKEADEQIAKKREAEEEKEKAREDLLVAMIEGVNAAIALGEATARAVQRIPDAKCNGDMHEALEYATEVKHRQKKLLAETGIRAVY